MDEVSSRGGEITIQSFTGGSFAQNTLLVACARTRAAILIDPGAATPQALRAARAGEYKIAQIVLTHAHLDHVEGVAEAKLATSAPILLHPADLPLYAGAPQQATWFGMRLEPLPPVDASLAEGEPVRFGDCELAVRFTPGHAPGHVILIGDGVAIVGDCIFAGSIGRTDLPGGDLQELMHSIRTQILTLPDATTLFAGHGPETTVGHERVSNPFLVPQFGGSAFA